MVRFLYAYGSEKDVRGPVRAIGTRTAVVANFAR